MPPKVGIFVDVQNIYYTCRDTYQRLFDYRAFWQKISIHHTITHAYAYAIDRNDQQQQKFQDALRYIGFEVKLKPYISRSDGSSKGDWDVGITMDIMRHAEDLDKVILLSGDGDFAPLLEYITQQHNAATEVWGVEALTARSLIKAASDFQPISPRLLVCR